MPQPLKRMLLLGDAFGLPQLLARIPNHVLAGIVVASNRPASYTPVAAFAEQRGLPLLVQPSFRDSHAYAAFIASLKDLRPDSILCHSYAMLVRKEMLDMVKGNAFNMHAALLPRHRGPNPIQWSLIHGDDCTGVTLHVMDAAFDTGDIIAQESITIHDDDSWVTLSQKLSVAAEGLLDANIETLIQGNWSRAPQDNTLAVHNKRISPESFLIDFATMDDRTIFNLIRAQISPLVGAYIETSNGRTHYPHMLSLEEIAQLRIRCGY